MGLRGRLAEFILHITNFVYFLSGVGVLVVGSIALGSPSTLVDALSYVPSISELSNVVDISGVALGPAIYLTCLGSLVVVLCIMGAGGLVGKKGKSVVITIYVLTTLLVMLFNVAVVMFYVIDPYFIQDTVKYNMEKILKQDFTPVSFASNGSVIMPTNEKDIAWVTMQFEESCCGIENITDYNEISWLKNVTFPNNTVIDVNIPPSCCALKYPGTVATSVNDFVDLSACVMSKPTDTKVPYTNTKGCSDYIMQEVTRYNIVYPIVAAGMTGLQAIILGLTAWLMRIDSNKAV